MTTREGCIPSEVSRPFDAEASGLVSAEGAGVVILESLDHAERRGARIRAELVGYAAANDACTVMHPHGFGRGLAQAVAKCLDRSGARAYDVDAVLAPATSLPEHDRATARSLEPLFRKSRRTVFTATRSMLGHAHAASAGLDCVAAVRAVETSQLPPAINVTRPITDLALATASTPVDVRTAVVGAYGFGGHAAALAWRRYTP
jgi:3-oxoacyl-[acyl-carrier-protein] synthase II